MSRMLKKSASRVLASFRGSTYHRARAARAARGGVGENEYASPLRHWALTDSRPSADVTLIILRVADLAAALLDSLFEHPEVIPVSARTEKFHHIVCINRVFRQPAGGLWRRQ